MAVALLNHLFVKFWGCLISIVVFLFCTNHSPKESYCQSPAERVLFSVAIFDCLIVRMQNLVLTRVAALHPFHRVFFFAIEVVKLCTTISFCYLKFNVARFQVLEDFFCILYCLRQYLGRLHGLEEMHAGLNVKVLISYLCFFLSPCTCPGGACELLVHIVMSISSCSFVIRYLALSLGVRLSVPQC